MIIEYGKQLFLPVHADTFPYIYLCNYVFIDWSWIVLVFWWVELLGAFMVFRNYFPIRKTWRLNYTSSFKGLTEVNYQLRKSPLYTNKCLATQAFEVHVGSCHFMTLDLSGCFKMVLYLSCVCHLAWICSHFNIGGGPGNVLSGHWSSNLKPWQTAYMADFSTPHKWPECYKTMRPYTHCVPHPPGHMGKLKLRAFLWLKFNLSS